MSRIGKREIRIPEKTEVNISENKITVKGPLGVLSMNLKLSEVDVKVEGDLVVTKPMNESVAVKSLWGTHSSLITNMILGVNTLFEKKLIVEGVGFRAEVKGKELVLNLGFSHDIKLTIPDSLIVTSEKNNIKISGIDKEEVGRFTADIRALKKPEPYKGKGIRYENEVVRRKQGKKTA